jgi:cytochrome c biogenesis protein CcmG, thiol:disulfide interchange protein DsbE
MSAAPTTDAAPVRRRRIAPLIAVPLAVVMLLFVILLATRAPAGERLAKSPLVGKAAPAVEGVTTNNDQFTLDRVRGEWVVVNFFGSWCTPCIQEHPELVSFQNAHRGAHDATVVSVAFADSPTAVRQFFDKHGGDWPVLVEKTDGIAVSYGVIKVPETYLVSPTGLVVAKLIGGVTADGLNALIAKYTAPAPTASTSSTR